MRFEPISMRWRWTTRRMSPYRSQVPGVAHACGHDVHTAIVLGTALYFAHHRDELPGPLRFVFQPAEERMPGGALDVLRSRRSRRRRRHDRHPLHAENGRGDRRYARGTDHLCRRRRRDHPVRSRRPHRTTGGDDRHHQSGRSSGERTSGSRRRCSRRPLDGEARLRSDPLGGGRQCDPVALSTQGVGADTVDGVLGASPEDLRRSAGRDPGRVQCPLSSWPTPPGCRRW